MSDETMPTEPETMGEYFRAWSDDRKRTRARLGVSCPGCPKIQPKRIPTTMLPGQKCKVCGYRDPRKRQP